MSEPLLPPPPSEVPPTLEASLALESSTALAPSGPAASDLPLETLGSLARPELSGRRVLVVGLGESGLAMAQWAAFAGATVTVVDTREDPPQRAVLGRTVPQACFLAGALNDEALDGADLLAWSQGLSPTRGAAAAFYARAQARGLPIWGELDFFAVEIARLRALGWACTVVAITGTNGKTTTTQLVGHLCQAAGLKTRVAGNISPAALHALHEALIEQDLPQVWVLELASFQLALASRFEADASVILNLSEDHLDWHDDMAAYRAAKQKVHAGQGLCVVNRDDPASAPVPAPSPEASPRKSAARAARARTLPTRRQFSFGLGVPTEGPGFGVQHEGGLDWLVEALPDDDTGRRSRTGPTGMTAIPLRLRRLMPADALKMRGAHNRANALAALALARAAGAPLSAMLHALSTFEPGAHRCETIARIDEVDYIDDSKGTNVGATVAALIGADRPVVLIAGGDGKGQDFSPLAPAVRQSAVGVILIGRDAARLQEALVGCGVPIDRCDSLEAAVQRAAAWARPGQAVLMSPACASLDMFRNYVHRAQVFADAVKALASERGQAC
jgi:UDP-N-acetylmuramoylalanine--D-glutamate ligase